LYVIVVGLSGVGETLARVLVRRGHSVAVIDKDEERCKKFASEVDALVINGQAEDNDNLKNAGVEKADALVTATGDDSVNLMVCTMAKEFDVPTLVATVRDIEHSDLFRKLGVRIAAPDDVAAEHLYQQLLMVTDFLLLGGGGAELFSVRVEAASNVANKKVKDAKLPKGFQIISVYHKNQLVYPSQSIVIEPGDELLIFAPVLARIRNVTEDLLGKRRGS